MERLGSRPNSQQLPQSSLSAGDPGPEDVRSQGDRIADAVAKFGGSWTFIIAFLAGETVYVGLNIWLMEKAWDPYPFILLNLFLSMLAAIQAPVIMMSQNRQDAKDREHALENHVLNQRAEREIQLLNARMGLMMDKLSEIREHLQDCERAIGASQALRDGDHNRKDGIVLP